MLRRDFAITALGATGLLVATPRFARAVPLDYKLELDDPKHLTVGGHSAPKKEATTPQYLSYDATFDFQSPDVAQVDWKKHWPQNGKGAVVIDYKGNWQFSGSFPSQPDMVRDNRVTIAFVFAGNKADGIGPAIQITKVMTVTKSGATWSKSGSDQIVADLWKTMVGGHTHAWYSHTHPEVPSAPPPQDPPKSSSSGGGCTSSVGGAIGAFFSGGLSCV